MTGATIETALKTILDRNTLHADLQNHMESIGCTTVSAFANWVDKREDLKDAILNGSPQKDSASQLSRLKMAWRQAEAVVEKGLKRTSEGLSEEAVDEPLDEATQLSVTSTFKQAYGWTSLQPERMGADALLGRVYREFQQFKPTLLPVSKVRSLAHTQSRVVPSTKRRMGAGISITFDGEEEYESDGAGNLAGFLRSLATLCNTWAVAGAYTVTYNSETIRFANWPNLYEYMVKVEDEASALLPVYSEPSILTYVTAAEEELRTKALGLTRGDKKLPWGLALTQVIKDHSSVWDHKKDLLHKRSSPTYGQNETRAGGQGDGGTGTPRKPKGKGKGKDKTTPVKEEIRSGPEYKKSWGTAKDTSGGKTICKYWNDSRGCKSWCPRKHEHVCDVLLANGKACGSRGHNRAGHKVAEHGAPTYR